MAAMITDEALVERVLEGDPAATHAWVQRWSTPLYNFAYRFTGSAEDARDVTQEALMKALRHLSEYDSQWRFSTWIYRITRNTCIDLQRRRRPTAELNEETIAEDALGGRPSSPLQAALFQEDSLILHQAMGSLRENYREIVVLYHFENLSYREISDMLEIPIGTVMNRLFRARAMLREELSRREYTP